MISIPTGRGMLADTGRISAAATGVAARVRAAAPDILRVLLLLLVGLLGLCASLICLTGRYDVGVLVIGGVLFVSFGAANWAR